MDMILAKLREAGPQTQKRDARRRARLRDTAKQRKASATLDAGLSGDDGTNAEKEEAGLSSGGGGAGDDGLSDVGTDVDIPVSKGAGATSGSNTSALRSVSSQLSPDDDDTMTKARAMLGMLKGEDGAGGEDESDNVSLNSRGSFRSSKRTNADEGRKARRRQRQASSSANGGSGGLTAPGAESGPVAGEDEAAKAKSFFQRMSARRGSAEENGTHASPGLPDDASGSFSMVDEPVVVGGTLGGSDGMPTPTIEIKEVD